MPVNCDYQPTNDAMMVDIGRITLSSLSTQNHILIDVYRIAAMLSGRPAVGPSRYIEYI